MGALGKQQAQQGLDTQSLSSFLGTEQQKAKESSPDLMGQLSSLLDKDRDGSPLDDILGMVGRLFRGR